MLVQFADGFQSAGTVIRFDEAWDLAAISIWKPKATPVQLAQRNPIPGEPLSIAGYGRGAYREQRGRCTEYLSPGVWISEGARRAAGHRRDKAILVVRF